MTFVLSLKIFASAEPKKKNKELSDPEEMLVPI
jgi:hypothetical protein